MLKQHIEVSVAIHHKHFECNTVVHEQITSETIAMSVEGLRFTNL